MHAMRRVMLAQAAGGGGGSIGTPEFDVDATTLSVVADGTAVTSWPDNSGNGRNGSGSSSAATYRGTSINGRAAVRTTGTDPFGFPRPVQDDWTIYIVLKWLSGGGGVAGASQWYDGAPLFDTEVSGTQNDWGICLMDNGRYACGVGNPDGTVTAGGGGVLPITDGTPHILCVTRNATTGVVTLYTDETLVGTGTLATGTKTSGATAYIGASGSLGVTVSDFGRILAYTSAHDATTRGDVHAALRTQFGL